MIAEVDRRAVAWAPIVCGMGSHCAIAWPCVHSVCGPVCLVHDPVCGSSAAL